MSVGVPRLQGKLARYPFGLLEIQAASHLPRPKVLRAMKAERPGLTYSVRTQPSLLEAVTQEELTRVAQACEALQAEVVVLTSGPRFGPTERNRQILAQCKEAFQGKVRHVAWEPHGAFDEVGDEWATDLGLLLVRDVTRESSPDGEVLYTRLRALGASAKITQYALDQLLEATLEREEAYVVIEGQGAMRVHQELMSAAGMVTEAMGEEGELDDEEDDFEDFDDEDEDEDE
jgi:hypothetical protein